MASIYKKNDGPFIAKIKPVCLICQAFMSFLFQITVNEAIAKLR